MTRTRTHLKRQDVFKCHFCLKFIKISNKICPHCKIETEYSRKSLDEKLAMSVSEIGLDTRIINKLDEISVYYVYELLSCTKSDLMGIKGFGDSYYQEVIRKLTSIGLKVNS